MSGAPTAYGSVTIIPVNYAHPNVTVPGRSLSYFWRVKSSGFTLGTATVTHGFTYNDVNVVAGAGISEDGYTAARYSTSSSSWSRGTSSDVDEINNIIGEPGAGSFLENTANIDGDYTAGDDNPANPFGTPAIYYSRQSGTWGTAATWSLTSHTVTNPPVSPPGVNDIVIIGNGHTVSFGTPPNYLTTQNTDPHNCATLQIETGAILDIRFNPASTFSMVQSHPNGNGTIRIAASSAPGSTFAFPRGDFSDFNQNLGTTELYSTNAGSGTTYWLPNGIGSYGNLIISPLGGSNIIFPNNNLIILGNLIMKGQNADSWFCPTWNGNYPNPPAVRIAKTITVMHDFDIQGGSFGWYGNGGGGSQDIVVNGDVKVAPGAGIDVWSSNSSQSMSIGGSLVNNSSNTTAPFGTLSYVNLSLVPVTFTGPGSATLSNTSGTPRTVLGKVIVNKGNSQASTLTISIDGLLTTPADNWLTMLNGTLQYMRTNPAAGANFTVSTTTPFNIPSTAGLYIDYSNANNVSVLIGNAANNNGDLLLSGKLTLVRGNVYIGQAGAPDNHNDIQYSGSGASEMDLQGGVLVVNGNIRRSGTSGGILKYSQSGNSSVTINGRGALTSNGKLEILNSGSSFNMSGTSTLTLIRGGSIGTFGDLYLRPETSSVTGGTIFIKPVTGITAAEETFKTDVSVPLNNLTITGFAAADAARVSLSVNALVLAGNLTLTNANSFLAANNLDVTIRGDFSNSGTYTYGSNTTSFTGNTQSISGSTITNFNNLVVSPVTSLSVIRSFTVNGNLNIGSGTLLLSNFRLSLLGNIINNGTYTDDNTTGGVTLAGTSIQQISGTGSFGRVELNNNAGARLNSDITIQNNLLLTLGKLDINSNLLTLGLNNNIGGAPFSLNNMIVSEGVASSKGVRKFFNIISAPTSFVFPVGVPGKYTPATYSINTNGAVGYINVNPINNNHPAVVDPNNVLNYYWEIESSGITNFDGSLSLKYMSADVRGTESDYIAARLLVPGTYWSKATPGALTDNVDESTQLISFPMPAGTNNLSGDYTAGADPAIPDEVPTYISIMDGNWSDGSIWLPVGSSPPTPVGGPNGFIVIIDHKVSTDNDFCFAYKTTINNELLIKSPTFGHNLGLVDGTGTLFLESGNLPAGNFNTFLSCAGGGTLEYGGTGNYTIIASQYNSVSNLLFTGSGTRILPNKDLTICNRLVIDGPTLDNSSNNRSLIIKGTLERYNTGAFRAGTGGNATVSFQGTTAQTLGGALGSFNGSNRFNNLEINNGAGLTLGSGTNEVSGNLLLTNGIITATNVNRLIISNTLSACVIPAGGSASSFVSGPLTKYISSGSSFNYPIGTGATRGHTFTMTTAAGAVAQFTAAYYSPNVTSGAYTAPLQAVNTDEYWSIASNAARNGYVKMAWDINSDLTPLMTTNGLPDMRAALFSAGSWQGQVSTASGSNSAGDVTNTNAISIGTTAQNFTIGSVTSTIPRASLAPTGPVCGSAGIPVRFTSFNTIPLNYTLDYTVDGVSQTPVVVSSLPYSLPTVVPGVYQLTGFKYNNGLNTGVVDNTPVTAYSAPTASNAGMDQSLCGLTTTMLAGNDPVVYPGLWSIVSGSGGTLLSPTLFNSSFIGIAGNNYTLRWTIRSGTCTSSDNVNIAFPVAPQRPSGFTSAPASVCQGVSGYVYTVPNVPGTTYNWSYSGSGASISGTGNSVTIAYGSSSTSGTLSVTATNGCGTSTARSVPIIVNLTPSITSTSPGTTCGAGTVSLGATSSAGTIHWYSSASGGASIGTGTTFITPVISSTTTYFADATSGSCTTLTRTPVIATVNPVPSAPAVGIITQPTCIDPVGSVILNNLPAGSWIINPGAITGNTASTTISGLAPGTYVYTVTNSAGCISSATSDVVIDPQPTVPDPAGIITGTSIVCQGQTLVSYSIPVIARALSYSWIYSGSGAVVSGNTDAITIDFDASATSGNLTVLGTNACGDGIVSASYPVTVNTAPAITTQPTNQTTCEGTSVSFSVTATGTGLTYQWRKGAVNIGGATSATYTIAAPIVGDAGSYDVVVSGTCAPAVTSSAVTLTVNTAPAITTQPTNQTTCAGTSVNFSVTATGTGLTYQWRKGAVNIVGATASTYTIAAPVTGDAGSYDVVVSGTCAPAVTSSAVTLTVNTAPAITTQPTNQTTCAGTSVSFSVTATGTGLTYQWRKGAVNIVGATASTYTIAAPIVGDAGSYDVVVSGTCAPAVTSAAVTLTVNTAPAITAAHKPRPPVRGQVQLQRYCNRHWPTYQWRKGSQYWRSHRLLIL
ncbi:MAG: hypothetical protein IPJ37_19655 [Bacteroidales bacterium]|nr:hypothetical protein [Bacteroidales bacterium]